MDDAGSPIPFQVKTSTREINSPLGTYTVNETWAVLKEWFSQQKMDPKDHLLVTVEDWERGVFRLEREPFGDQHPEQIQERDELVANTLFQLLESTRGESVLLPIAIPTLYAHLPDKAACPPDHWRYILQQDKRMKLDIICIRYAESSTLFDDLFGNLEQEETHPKTKPEKQPAKAECKSVYRFRAVLNHRPATWRDIEIQGEQTLAELDFELRAAFNHDHSDHLSGFWKLIPRGSGSGSGKDKRFREVEITVSSQKVGVLTACEARHQHPYFLR